MKEAHLWLCSMTRKTKIISRYRPLLTSQKMFLMVSPRYYTVKWKNLLSIQFVWYLRNSKLQSIVFFSSYLVFRFYPETVNSASRRRELWSGPNKHHLLHQDYRQHVRMVSGSWWHEERCRPSGGAYLWALDVYFQDLYPYERGLGAPENHAVFPCVQCAPKRLSGELLSLEGRSLDLKKKELFIFH